MGLAKYRNTSYAGYDKNHKERDALDYYATPPEEVTNILKQLKINFHDTTILEPCCGDLHMVKGIKDYLTEQKEDMCFIAGTDIKERAGCTEYTETDQVYLGYGEKYDVLSEDFAPPEYDWIIMNPPYSVIEPFTMRMLGLAKRGVLMLARLQFLEGQGRYENILKENPPTDVYVYVDRIACYKNGDFSKKESSAQAYAWILWDFSKEQGKTEVHWIRRADKVC